MNNLARLNLDDETDKEAINIEDPKPLGESDKCTKNSPIETSKSPLKLGKRDSLINVPKIYSLRNKIKKI